MTFDLNAPLLGAAGAPQIGSNSFINGAMTIAQRALSLVMTAGLAVPTASLGYPTVDMWYAYSTGANPTMAQVAGTGTSLFRTQFTGIAATTAIGFGQRVESTEAARYAGNNAVLSVDLSNSLLTTVTWTAFRPTTTADTYGTIGTPTRTQIATGTFTVSPTLARYSATFACDTNVRNGIEVVLTVGAQTSGTWVIGDAKLEVGSVATPFVGRVNEFAECLRFYQKQAPYAVAPNATFTISAANTNALIFNTGATNFIGGPSFARMFAIPVITFSDGLGNAGVIGALSGGNWLNGQSTSMYTATESSFTILSGSASSHHYRYQLFAQIP